MSQLSTLKSNRGKDDCKKISNKFEDIKIRVAHATLSTLLKELSLLFLSNIYPDLPLLNYFATSGNTQTYLNKVYVWLCLYIVWMHTHACDQSVPDLVALHGTLCCTSPFVLLPLPLPYSKLLSSSSSFFFCFVLCAFCTHTRSVLLLQMSCVEFIFAAAFAKTQTKAMKINVWIHNVYMYIVLWCWHNDGQGRLVLRHSYAYVGGICILTKSASTNRHTYEQAHPTSSKHCSVNKLRKCDFDFAQRICMTAYVCMNIYEHLG